MQTLPWIVAFVASLLLVASVAWALRMRGRRRPETLPTEWELTARPVFSADERRVHRALREALPHHVLLSRLPLLRFCQATDPGDAAYWHHLLVDSHVGFAVCSANGRVLAAVDLDEDRSPSRRTARIKQAALSACRIRYLRCAADQLPSVAELQLLVPSHVGNIQPPQPAPPSPRPPPPPIRARDLPPVHRSPRPVLWQDSTVFQDSFFPADDILDDASTEIFEPAAGRRAVRPHGPVPGRFFSAVDPWRRRPPPADFAQTQQQDFDDDDDDDDVDERDAGERPRRSSSPGSRP